MKKLFGFLIGLFASLTPKKALAWGVAIIGAGIISAGLLEIDYMEYATDGAAQSAWVSSDATPLQSYSESTIKTQGDYALKLLATTDALNETVTKTLTGGDILDLTGKNTIKLDARSTGTGSNLEMSIRDSGNENSGNLFIEVETDITDKNGTHTITAAGDAAISKAQFSGYNNSSASVYLDGTGDYLEMDSHADFTWSGDFTTDLFVRFSVLGAGNPGLIDMWADNPNAASYKFAVVVNDAYNGIDVFANGTWIINSGDISLTTGTWYHIAVAKSGNNTKLFVNGVQKGSTYPTAFTTLTPTTVEIGRWNNSTAINAYMDNIRIVKGTALWTSGFNLTDAELLYAKYQTHTINISSADTYQTDSWDISGVSDADKNAIDQLQFKVLNAGSARDFYIDNVYGQ